MKLTNDECLISKQIYTCTECEKLQRKKLINKIEKYTSKLLFFKKKQIYIRNNIKKTEDILNGTDISSITKYKEAKQLAILLLKHGKEKLGLEYYRKAILYKEYSHGSDSFQAINEHANYNLMVERTSRILHARRENSNKYARNKMLA